MAAKILLVEDEGIIASHIESRLRRAGYEVAGIAQSSEEALQKVLELEPDLILMDIRIKGSMDGIETTAELKERFDIPVIYLTAHTDEETINRAKLTGAAGFLSKPIHTTTLRTSVEMAIHKHQSDREIRQQRAWMGTLLGTMASAMVVIDCEGKVQFLNRPAEELTGWTRPEAEGRDIGEVLPLTGKSSDITANDVFAPPANLQAASRIPCGLIAKNRLGKRFPIEGEIAPSVDGGRVVGLVITFRDGTVRAARENEQRHRDKMQAVGRLAAGIAHDFNNLLSIILGYTELLMDVPATDERNLRAFREIRRAGEYATEIMQQLLRFSRKEPVEKQVLNLNDVIMQEEDVFRRLCGDAIECQFSLAQNLGAVRANRGQLNQVLMNLLANARDAMPAGGKLTIRTANIDVPSTGAPYDYGNALVCLSVSDTGTGMTRETADKLFEPFFTTKEPGKGTGLGLAIVHSIVMDLGGSIYVDSKPGRGTTFTMYIPRAEATAGRLELSNTRTDESDVQKQTVLLVEDQGDLRYVLRDRLLNAGYRVLEARNGKEAIRLASEYSGRIELMIADAMLPKKSAFEAGRIIQEGRKEMKFIFMSEYCRELLDGKETLPAGSQFLRKPFRTAELLKNIKELLRQEKGLAKGSSA